MKYMLSNMINNKKLNHVEVERENAHLMSEINFTYKIIRKKIVRLFNNFHFCFKKRHFEFKNIFHLLTVFH